MATEVLDLSQVSSMSGIVEDSFYEVISIKKIPEIEIEKLEENLFCIGFKQKDINLFAEGTSREEALRNFWDYLYDLFPLLEREKNIGPLPKKQLAFLREFMEHKVTGHE